MDNQEVKKETILSALKIRHVVFDKVTFIRKGFQKVSDTTNEELDFQVGVSVDKESDGEYRVTLGVLVEREDEYTAEVQVTGYCSIDENNKDKEVILKKNVVAILFPYVRSELTLITAQPEMTPIVLPAVNINAMIDKLEKIQN